MRVISKIRQCNARQIDRFSSVVAKNSKRVFSFSTQNGAEFSNNLNNWSGGLSFTTPESDFASVSYTKASPQSSTLSSSLELEKNKEHTTSSTSLDGTWSHSLSFASPESDFSNPLTNERKLNRPAANISYSENSERDGKKVYSNALSTAAPNTDLLMDDMMRGQLNQASKQHFQRFNIAGAVQDPELLKSPDKHSPMGDDLSHFDQVNKKRDTQSTDIFSHEEPLPTTIFDASRIDDDRAIVITEAVNPFRVVSVNPVWEGLCGFTQDECQGKTLSILQGTETDQAAITALLNKLLQGEKEVGTVLTNYKKTGDKFVNRLRVGPLLNHFNEVTHYVGVLEDVSRREKEIYV